jgi:RNA polymerase sigma-70 factor (ECF subfamily)
MLTRPWAAAAEHAVAKGGDGALLERIARREVGALRELYDRHARRAMAIALRILRDESAAEDVVQETFLDVWRRAAGFDVQRGDAAAWIVTIARSRAIDRLRSSGRASRAIAAASGMLTPLSEPLPSDQTERHRERAQIAAALGELPAKQRQTIELAYFDGLSQSEIATRTGNPLGTVKARVKLAMTKLTRLLTTQEA